MILVLGAVFLPEGTAVGSHSPVTARQTATHHAAREVPSRGPVHVKGRAYVAGHPARHQTVNVLLHGVSGQPLATAKTDGNGYFVARSAASAAMTSYAHRHGRWLNLDVAYVTDKGHREFVVCKPVKYGPTMRLGTTRMKAISTLNSQAKSLERRDTTTVSTHFDPQVLYISHGADEATTFGYRNTKSTEFAASFGTDAFDLTLSGSYTLGDNEVASASGTYGKLPNAPTYGKGAAETAQIGINGQKVITCAPLMTAEGYPAGELCNDEQTYSWDGNGGVHRQHYTDCYSVPSQNTSWYTSKDGIRSFYKASGKSFTYTLRAGGPNRDTFVEAKTSYSSDVSLNFDFGLKGVKGHDYCLGGTDDNWPQASQVVIMTVPKRSAGPSPCRLVRASEGGTWSASFAREREQLARTVPTC